MCRITLRTWRWIISCWTILTWIVTSFTKSKCCICEVILWTRWYAGLVLVEIEIVAWWTYSRTLVHADTWSCAVSKWWSIIVKKGEGSVKSYIVANATKKTISEEILRSKICYSIWSCNNISITCKISIKKIKILSICIF